MNDERTTAYLLNELREHEAEQFEEQCFAQPEWPDAELDSAEEDLVHAYIKNELSPEQRRRFEEHYLTTEAREERVLLSRAFLLVACSPAPPKASWTQRVLAFLQSLVSAPESAVPRFAAILLAVGLGVTLLWFALRTRAPQTFADVNLVITSENRSAGGPAKRVTLPLNEDALRISLELPYPAPQGAQYRVQLEDIKGPLRSLEIEKQDAKSISVIIPAEELSPGQFSLKLFRKNPDGTEQGIPGSYLFNVEWRSLRSE